MYERIISMADDMQAELAGQRRDFHKFAETGWFEIRTASVIARKLTELGYVVFIGRDVCLDESRMGVPEQKELDQQYERALAQGADLEFASQVKDGFTGVIGILRCGNGPVAAMRFDIDALGVIEDTEDSHRPAKCGFNSVNPVFMHACGHDGHAAIGLGVAKILMDIRQSLHGTVKLIFQPAEEGVRGAKSIVDKGHLDDVDYFLGSHITGISDETGTIGCDIIPGAGGALATTKLDVYFYGKAAHAGGSPEKGKNVMLSVAAAISGLYSIPRHSKGSSRINVGTVHAGSGRNVIADEAKLELEVRGATTEINQYMEEYAVRIIKAAADMHDNTCKIQKMGGAYSMESDIGLMERISQVCQVHLGLKPTAYLCSQSSGSEDISYMMKRVQEHGGQASFMRILTDTAAPGHSRQFDFDERVLSNGVKAFCGMAYDILKKS